MASAAVLKAPFFISYFSALVTSDFAPRRYRPIRSSAVLL
ncbi:Uncharacterised protein [Mycobacterium tuberculosis]|nr:Uncharacterised protein [Mycobacterium tuberculosis]